MSWCFYVLRCVDESLYAGSTNDMARRFAAHNSGVGARYTSGRGPVRLVWVEPHGDRASAQRAEAAFKKLSRPAKLHKIAAGREDVLNVPKIDGAQLGAGWDDPGWSAVSPRSITEWRPESGAQRPSTELKLAWNRGGLLGIFRVEDENVRALETLPNSPVYIDSCVELFLQPPKVGGYFNFEWNAGGAMLAGFVTDPTRNEDGTLKGLAFLGGDEAALIRVEASLGPAPFVKTGKVVWTLSFNIPFALLGLKGVEGEGFKGNFFKCGDRTTAPHWGSWRPLTARNFHQPENFGDFFLFG